MKLSVPFILASRSPRRRRLLSRIGMEFDVHVSEADESIPAGKSPDQVARELALRKAEEVAGRHPEALTLGADTIVVLDGDILGKPVDEDHARDMLHRLSGAKHTVFTGIALVYPALDRKVTAFEATEVTFAEMDEEEISAYASSGSPLDKAGAYGIQDDRGALFVRRIEGDYYNVVGLPLHRLYRTIKTDFRDVLAGDYLL